MPSPRLQSISIPILILPALLLTACSHDDDKRDSPFTDTVPSRVDLCPSDVVINYGYSDCALLTYDSNCHGVKIPLDCDDANEITSASPAQAQSITDALRRQAGVK